MHDFAKAERDEQTKMSRHLNVLHRVLHPGTAFHQDSTDELLFLQVIYLFICKFVCVCVYSLFRGKKKLNVKCLRVYDWIIIALIIVFLACYTLNKDAMYCQILRNAFGDNLW